MAGVAGWRLLAVFRDADVAIVIPMVIMIVLFLLRVLGSCSEVCAVVIIFIRKFAGHEG